MRRNIDEVKAALALRLEEYNAKRRAKRKMAACFAAVVLTASVTAAAVPALVVTSDEKNAAAGAPSHKGENYADDGYGNLGGADEMLEGDTPTPETDRSGIGSSLEAIPGSVGGASTEDSTKNSVTEEIYMGDKEITVTVIDGETEIVLSEATTAKVIEVLRTSVKKSDSRGVCDAEWKLSVIVGEKEDLISVTSDGNIIYKGEYYETKYSEILLELLEP